MARPVNPANKITDPALHYFNASPDLKSLVDYHFVVPMPRGVVPSKVFSWCRENLKQGWLAQMPRTGHPTWKNTVILFSDEDEMAAFRTEYCFEGRFNRHPDSGDWRDELGKNK